MRTMWLIVVHSESWNASGAAWWWPVHRWCRLAQLGIWIQNVNYLDFDLDPYLDPDSNLFGAIWIQIKSGHIHACRTTTAPLLLGTRLPSKQESKNVLRKAYVSLIVA